jgi:hypothetical protein
MRTNELNRGLWLTLGVVALTVSATPQRLNWLGPIEVRGVSNSGLVIGKSETSSGGVRTVRVHRRLVLTRTTALNEPSWGLLV